MNKGFTLIELLIVLSIISLLSVLVLPNLGLGEKQFSIVTSTYKLAQDFRRVQEMAMSSAEFDGVISPGGYGIKIIVGNNFYVLFADLDADRQYDLNEKIGDDIYLDGGTIFQTSATIVFVPPDPTVYGAPKSIVISDPSAVGLSSKTVKINIAGLISIE
ncbi:type II secretion system GspH family protein [Patescibacteria group bacterium]|nr:type II secretion system GspH family protein [Patescibacteria group bacterium]MBU1877213.1 type II secretion system GspH family protein [Patescibacteria group bacterium]